MNSGIEKTLRGKVTEASGKEITNADRQEIKIKASSVDFKRCPTLTTTVDQYGIFQLRLPVMNNSISYSVSIEATRVGFIPIIFDLNIGGVHYHKQDQVELGSF